MDGFGTFVWADGRKYTGSVLICINLISIRMIRSLGRVNFCGLMADLMKAIGTMENNMDRVFI